MHEDDPFYPNLAFKRAELAAAMGDYALGADLMSESVPTFEKGGRHSYQMSDPNARAHFYNQVRLLGHCLLGAGRASEAIDVLLNRTLPIQQDIGKHPKIDRDFHADLAWCFYELGEYEKAIDVGQEVVIEMNRAYAKAHKYVALSQRAMGRLDDAIATMRQAVCYEAPWDAANRHENSKLLTEFLKAAEK